MYYYKKSTANENEFLIKNHGGQKEVEKYFFKS